MALLTAYEGQGSLIQGRLRQIGEPLQLRELVTWDMKEGFMIGSYEEDTHALENFLHNDPRHKANRFYLTPDEHLAILILQTQSKGDKLTMNLALQRPILVSLLTLPIESYLKE